MGEPLYEEVVGPDKLDRALPHLRAVGSHETLLAYLVRRLLENGANTSFVNRIGDAAVPVDALVADPVALVRAALPLGAPHPRIALPRDLFGAGAGQLRGSGPRQRTAAGLAGGGVAGRGGDALAGGADARRWHGGGTDAGAAQPRRPPRSGRSCHRRIAAPRWIRRWRGRGRRPGLAGHPAGRARRLPAPRRRPDGGPLAALLGVIVREAGKTLANAVGELREAVDFLRYYAAEGEKFANDSHRPLGPVACISPWNFPLAIFTGQIAAALAAGNAVLAKPAEETPLIAAQAVAFCMRPACRRAPCNCCPAMARLVPNWFRIRGCAGWCSPAQPRWRG